MDIKQLVDYATSLIHACQDTLRRDDDVLPAIITVREDGHANVYGINGKTDANIRAALRQSFAKKDGADAVVTISDAYRRDPKTMEVVGEQLTATIELRAGITVALSCPYTRNPFVFQPITQESQTIVAQETFSHDRTIH